MKKGLTALIFVLFVVSCNSGPDYSFEKDPELQKESKELHEKFEKQGILANYYAGPWLYFYSESFFGQTFTVVRFDFCREVSNFHYSNCSYNQYGCSKSVALDEVFRRSMHDLWKENYDPDLIGGVEYEDLSMFFAFRHVYMPLYVDHNTNIFGSSVIFFENFLPIEVEKNQSELEKKFRGFMARVLYVKDMFKYNLFSWFDYLFTDICSFDVRISDRQRPDYYYFDVLDKN